MIVVTGAGGFIGSALVNRLNSLGEKDIIVIDSFSSDSKGFNLQGLNIRSRIERENFILWLENNGKDVDFIFHLGARTDTRERDVIILQELNTDYTKSIWALCTKFRIPLIYASSAATYGNGDQGFVDDESKVRSLRPLNEYAISKHNFDVWALAQKEKPPFWVGLKFFNVYGPNEYHKGHMASVIFHGYNQIVKHQSISLFKSHYSLYKDGEQKRDFIYIKDILNVCVFFMRNATASGIYNVGTGQPRTFVDLAGSIFSTLGKKKKINFVDIPVGIRDNYQYYTAASMTKLKSIGFTDSFYTLEEGIEEYIGRYLRHNRLISQN